MFESANISDDDIVFLGGEQRGKCDRFDSNKRFHRSIIFSVKDDVSLNFFEKEMQREHIHQFQHDMRRYKKEN